VTPTPLLLFLQKGGTLPPSSPNQSPLSKNDDPATSGFSVGVPCEILVSVLERLSGYADLGGRGVAPTPPHSFFPKGGHPPFHVPGPVGVPPQEYTTSVPATVSSVSPHSLAITSRPGSPTYRRNRRNTQRCIEVIFLLTKIRTF